MSGGKIDQKLGALRKIVADVLQSAQASRAEVLEQVDTLAEQVRKMHDHHPAPAEGSSKHAAAEPAPKRKKLKAVKRAAKAAHKTRRKK